DSGGPRFVWIDGDRTGPLHRLAGDERPGRSIRRRRRDTFRGGEDLCHLSQLEYGTTAKLSLNRTGWHGSLGVVISQAAALAPSMRKRVLQRSDLWRSGSLLEECPRLAGHSIFALDTAT